MFVKGNSKSAFTIEHVSEKQTKDLLKARSSLDQLRDVVAIFKSRRHEALHLRHLIAAIRILSMLICFLHDQEYVEGFDYVNNQISLEPLKERQAIMKELGVIDILMDLVHFPFENGFFNVEEVERPLYISKVVSLGYLAIKSVIKELRPNELYASQWLYMFADYAMKDTKNILKVKETLTELIDNNEKILDVQITDTLVDHILDYFFNSPPDSKVVNIIRAMCICNGRPVIKNQQKIAGILLPDRTTLDKVLPQLKINDLNQVSLENPWDDTSEAIRLKDLKQKSESIDGGRYFEFYVSLIELLRDICLGRNYHSINIVKAFFPIDALVEVVCNTQFDASLRTSCAKLAETLYIDVFPYHLISMPFKVRDFSAVSTNSSKLQLGAEIKAEDNNKLARLRTFILEIVQSPPDLSDLLEYSDLYIQTINLCQKMLRLGYFKNFGDIKNIYDGILKMVATDWTSENLKALIKLRQKFDLTLMSGMLSSLSLKSRLDSAEFYMKATRIRMALCSIMVDLLDVNLDFQLTKAANVYKGYFESRQSGSIYRHTLENLSLVNADEENQGSIEVSSKTVFDSIVTHSLKSDSLIQQESTLKNFLIDNTLSENKELKDFSFELLKKVCSGGQRLFSHLGSLVILDKEEDRHLFKRATEIQGYLLKMIEDFSMWFNAEHSLNTQYTQLLDLCGKLDEDFREAGRINVIQLGTDIDQMSSNLYELSQDHLFVKIHLLKMLESVSHFYQDMMEKTGVLDCLVKLLNLMVSEMIDSTRRLKNEVLAANKVIIDKLILLICKSIHDNPHNKFKMVPHILSWINYVTALDPVGHRITPKSTKNIFSVKNLPTDLATNSRDGFRSKRFKKSQTFDTVDSDVPPLTNLIQLVVLTLRDSSDYLTDRQLTSSIVHSLVSVLTSTDTSCTNSYLMAECLASLEEMLLAKKSFAKEYQSMIVKMLAAQSKNGVLARYQTSTVQTVVSRDLSLPALDERIENTSVALVAGPLCLDLAFVSLVGCCAADKFEYAERIAQSILPPR